MKKIFYEKIGRRYKPVYEYDQTLMDALPKGSHLILVYPGGKSTRYNIDPNFAALIAAGRIAEDTISSAIMEAAQLRPKTSPLTDEQRAAWEHLVEVFGEEAKCLTWPSAREVADKAVHALEVEADKLMQNESVRLAYEHFQLICKLTVEDKNGT